MPSLCTPWEHIYCFNPSPFLDHSRCPTHVSWTESACSKRRPKDPVVQSWAAAALPERPLWGQSCIPRDRGGSPEAASPQPDPRYSWRRSHWPAEVKSWASQTPLLNGIFCDNQDSVFPDLAKFLSSLSFRNLAPWDIYYSQDDNETNQWPAFQLNLYLLVQKI